MKKVFLVLFSAIAMAFVSVSCDTKIDDDGNRVASVYGTIYNNALYDDNGIFAKLLDNIYPDNTRGFFYISYNIANVQTDSKGNIVSISNAHASHYSVFVVLKPESVSEAEEKGVDITKLDGYDDRLYCEVSGGFLQLSGYDRYENDSLYHVVYDINKQKNDTLRVTLCNTGKAQSRTRQMHVEFDLESVNGIYSWNDSLVVCVEPAVGKRVTAKVAKKDLKKSYMRNLK